MTPPWPPGPGNGKVAWGGGPDTGAPAPLPTPRGAPEPLASRPAAVTVADAPGTTVAVVAAFAPDGATAGPGDPPTTRGVVEGTGTGRVIGGVGAVVVGVGATVGVIAGGGVLS